MSAVVRAEDAAADTRAVAMSDGRLSPLLTALVTLQLALTLVLNMCYGSVFILYARFYHCLNAWLNLLFLSINITAAASAIPLEPHVRPVGRIRALPSPRPAISSSSSATLVPTSESGNKGYKYRLKVSVCVRTAQRYCLSGKHLAWSTTNISYINLCVSLTHPVRTVLVDDETRAVHVKMTRD
ncbi:hypothetical protein ACEPAG_4645 [Sanghuangporus baumii]